MSRRSLLLISLVLAPCSAWPQGDPLGPEFRVNTYTTRRSRGILRRRRLLRQLRRRLVRARGQDGRRLRRLRPALRQLGDAPRPGVPRQHLHDGLPISPSVAADARGNFVVVWRADGQLRTIRRLRPALRQLRTPPRPGVPRQHLHDGLSGVRPIRPSPPTPPATSSSSGDSFNQDGSATASSASATPAPAPPSARSSASTPTRRTTSGLSVRRRRLLRQLRRRLAEPSQDGSDDGVFGQRYASSGTPLGPEFRVNTYTTSYQGHPSVAADASGNFVVVWTSHDQDGSVTGVFGQRYASSGAPVGPEFRVNTYTTGYQSLRREGVSRRRLLRQLRRRLGERPGQHRRIGVFGQRYASSGSPPRPRVPRQHLHDELQAPADVAADSSGNFVVGLEQLGQDGSSWGVFGQRYSQIVPVELMRFGVE